MARDASCLDRKQEGEFGKVWKEEVWGGMVDECLCAVQPRMTQKTAKSTLSVYPADCARGNFPFRISEFHFVNGASKS